MFRAELQVPEIKGCDKKGAFMKVKGVTTIDRLTVS